MPNRSRNPRAAIRPALHVAVGHPEPVIALGQGEVGGTPQVGHGGQRLRDIRPGRGAQGCRLRHGDALQLHVLGHIQQHRARACIGKPLHDLGQPLAQEPADAEADQPVGQEVFFKQGVDHGRFLGNQGTKALVVCW